MTERIVFLVYLAFAAAVVCCSITRADEPDAALWLARSCVGEAGFHSGRTGECAAIAHVYRKRAAASGTGFYTAMRSYSAAIKSGGKKWVKNLRRDGQSPDGWPHQLDWSRYRGDWSIVVGIADAFVRGDVPDPLPTADHYGGWVDRHRIPANWVRLETPYRNRFYRIKK